MRRRTALAVAFLLAGIGAVAIRFAPIGAPPAKGPLERPPDEARARPSLELAPGGAGAVERPASGESASAPAAVPEMPANTHTGGLVVDEDGAPIVGATVTGQADVEGDITAGRPCTTDASGRFDVEVVDDDMATLTVVAPGCIERTVTRSTRFADPLVLQRENRSRVRLHLTGDLVEGDPFRVFQADPSMTIAPVSAYARPAWPPRPPQSWDDEPFLQVLVVNGVVELPHQLKPGATRLLLVSAGGSAGPVWVYAPPRAGIVDLDVKVVSTARVDVLVTRGGAPLGNAVVHIRGDGIGQDLGGGLTDATGRLSLTTLGVPRRTVTITAPGSASEPLPEGDARVVVDLPTPDHESDTVSDSSAPMSPAPGSQAWGSIEWPPPPPPVEPQAPVAAAPTSGRIVGRVEHPTWPPLESGWVTAIRWPFGSPPTGDDAETWQAGLGSSREFSFNHQPPGRYGLVLRCGSYAAMSEAPVEVRAGETTDVGALRLRRGATLSGRVSDARAVPRAFTRVRVADDGGALRLDTWTDPDGGYEVRGLWPGDWTATVGEEGAAEFARARARVSGDAVVRLDLRPAVPR